MFSPKLPLWNRVIFADWNGVLSREPFWTSILSSDFHPLGSRLKDEVRRIFQDRDLVERWMRGHLTSKEVVAELDVELDKRFCNDFLERRLLNDCERMQVNDDLIGLLSEASKQAFIVIATDNMDCFYEQILVLRSRRRVRSASRGPATLKSVVWRFDDVLCSSTLGTLKREEPRVFFGQWLEEHSLAFGQALLLDDSQTNCSVFEQAGGTAVRVLDSDFEDGFQRLKSTILGWLPHPEAIRHKSQSAAQE